MSFTVLIPCRCCCISRELAAQCKATRSGERDCEKERVHTHHHCSSWHGSTIYFTKIRLRCKKSLKSKICEIHCNKCIHKITIIKIELIKNIEIKRWADRKLKGIENFEKQNCGQGISRKINISPQYCSTISEEISKPIQSHEEDRGCKYETPSLEC